MKSPADGLEIVSIVTLCRMSIGAVPKHEREGVILNRVHRVYCVVKKLRLSLN